MCSLAVVGIAIAKEARSAAGGQKTCELTLVEDCKCFYLEGNEKHVTKLGLDDVDNVDREQEKGFAPSLTGEERPEEKFAHRISVAANPLFIAIPTLGMVAFRTAPDVLQGVLWWAITLIMSIAPFLFIRWGVRVGHYSYPHVSRRCSRLMPLLFGIGCVVGVFVLLILVRTSRPLLVTLIAVIVALSVATLITKFWKISFHLVGMAGAVTVFGIMLGPLFWHRWFSWLDGHGGRFMPTTSAAQRYSLPQFSVANYVPGKSST
jgi:hypothetical protein